MVKLPEDIRRKLEAATPPEREIIVTNLAGIEPVPLRFLWWPYLPLGKVVIVAGAPGHGKSQLTALMAGLATRGNFYPGDLDRPARVLIMSAEDDLDDTVVPRLLAVNADLRLVDTINARTTFRNGLTATGMIRVPGDVDAVHDYVVAHPDTALVVMDPVASFFERGHSTTVNQDVRDALDPLVAIARTYMVTIVVVLHLNKSESRDFANRISESHGFQALARSVLALGPDPDDEEGERGSKKILAITKSNLARAGNHAMRAEVRGATVRDSQGQPVETSELALVGKCEVSADDLLMPAAERTARLEAAEWLADFVGDRWVPVSEVRKAAMSDGISWRTLERVRTKFGYRRNKQAGISGGPWWMAAKDTLGGPPPTGGVGGLGSNTAKTARGMYPGRRSSGGVEGGPYFSDPENKNGKAANTARHVVDWDEYRRERDRRLGERDDDDE
jgi:AAA domain-containing protein